MSKYFNVGNHMSRLKLHYWDDWKSELHIVVTTTMFSEQFTLKKACAHIDSTMVNGFKRDGHPDDYFVPYERS